MQFLCTTVMGHLRWGGGGGGGGGELERGEGGLYAVVYNICIAVS